MDDNATSSVPKEKKKRNRTTKKVVAAENEKRLQMLTTLLECNSLPTYVSEVLKEEVSDFLYVTNSPILKHPEEKTLSAGPISAPISVGIAEINWTLKS